MKRGVVVGCAGSGKSTLARSLGATLGAPVAERDALGAEFVDDVVFPLADLVIAFDFPFHSEGTPCLALS